MAAVALTAAVSCGSDVLDIPTNPPKPAAGASTPSAAGASAASSGASTAGRSTPRTPTTPVITGTGSPSEFPDVVPNAGASAPAPDDPAPAGAEAPPPPSAAGASAPPPSAAGAGGTWEPGATCPKTIECGGTMCNTDGINSGVDSPNLCMSACCTADNACGVNVLTSLTDNGTPTCTGINQPGTASVECGAAAEEAGSAGPMTNPDNAFDFSITYCCRPDNRCGLFIPNIGVGCAAFEEIKNISPLFELIDLPPVACHYEPPTM